MISPTLLVAAIAVTFDLSVEELTGPSRQRHVVHARQAAAWVLRRAYASIRLETIATLLGWRDHTTVIHAIAQVERRRQDNPELAALLDDLVATPAPPRPIFLHQASQPRERPPAPAVRLSAGEIWWVAQARTEFLVRAA